MTDGSKQRLDCWAEHFRHQFSWPCTNVVSPMTTTEVLLDTPTEVEVKSKIRLLRKRKATDADELNHVIFKPILAFS